MPDTRIAEHPCAAHGDLPRPATSPSATPLPEAWNRSAEVVRRLHAISDTLTTVPVPIIQRNLRDVIHLCAEPLFEAAFLPENCTEHPNGPHEWICLTCMDRRPGAVIYKCKKKEGDTL